MSEPSTAPYTPRISPALCPDPKCHAALMAPEVPGEPGDLTHRVL